MYVKHDVHHYSFQFHESLIKREKCAQIASIEKFSKHVRCIIQCKERRMKEKYLQEQQSIKIDVVITFLSKCQKYKTFDTKFLLKLEKYLLISTDFVTLFP